MMANDVYTLSLDSQERVWAGTGQGIYIIEDDSIVSFIPNDTIGAGINKIDHILTDDSDTVICTNNYVYALKGGQWETISIFNADKCIKGPGDTLYFAVKREVKKYHGGAITSLGPQSDTILYEYDSPDIAIGPDGHLWAGSWKGLARYNAGVWEHFTEGNSPLGNTTVEVIDTDKNGNLWVFNNKNINVIHPSMVWDSIDYDTTNMTGQIKGTQFSGNGVFVYATSGLWFSFYKNYVPRMVADDVTIEEELENMSFVAPVIVDSSLFTKHDVEIKGAHAGYFCIKNNGLYISNPIDYETFGQDTLHLSFHLKLEQDTLDTGIVVTILNINDNAPIVNDSSFYIDYPFVADSILLGTIPATDKDGALNPLVFSVVDDSTGIFSFSRGTADFYILHDTSIADTHYVNVTVSDGLFSSSAIMQVVVNDTSTIVDPGDSNLVVNHHLENALTLFPNPAKHKVTIYNVDDYDYFSIINTMGNVLRREKITSGNLETDVSGLPPGLYILRFSNRHTAIEKKIIIQ